MSEQEIPTQPQSQPSSAAALFVDLKNSIDALAATRAPKSVKLNIHGGYSAARGIAKLISVIGWLLVIAGIVFAIFSLSPGSFGFGSRSPFVGTGGILGGVILAVFGILQVAVGQMMRAVSDTADYARQSLILKAAEMEGMKSVNTK